MELKEFEERLEILRIHSEKIKEFSSALEKICAHDVVIEISYDLIESYIDLLANKFGDNYQWIDWYIFENNWGKSNLDVKVDGVSLDINSYEKLYKLIKSK